MAKYESNIWELLCYCWSSHVSHISHFALLSQSSMKNFKSLKLTVDRTKAHKEVQALIIKNISQHGAFRSLPIASSFIVCWHIMYITCISRILKHLPSFVKKALTNTSFCRHSQKLNFVITLFNISVINQLIYLCIFLSKQFLIYIILLLCLLF